LEPQNEPEKGLSKALIPKPTTIEAPTALKYALNKSSFVNFELAFQFA